MAIHPRWTLGRLMLGVAVAAVLLAAGMYRWEHRDVDQATLAGRLRGLRDRDAGARQKAAADLGGPLDVDPAPAVAALTEAVAGDVDPGVREVAALALGRAMARDRDHRSKSGAAVEPDEGEVRALRALLAAVEESGPRVRRAAVAALVEGAGGFRWPGPARAAFLATTGRLLDDPDPDFREKAALGMAGAGPPSELRGQFVALMIADPAPKVRTSAIVALGLGWPGPDLYPIFLDRYGDATPAERSALLRGLWNNGPPPLAVVPRLAALMEAGDPAANQYIPHIVGRLGKAARPWLGAIARAAATQVATRPNPHFNAVEVLIRVDRDAPETREVIALLGRRFRDEPDEQERQGLAYCVERCAQAAGPLVPYLREALSRPDAALRKDAARLLGGVGPDAGPALADLDRLARDDPDPNVREAARRALDRIGAR